MASDAVAIAIKGFLLTHWTATPIGFENEFADAAGNPIPPDPAAPWVEMELRGWEYAQESLGASRQADNRWDESGTLLLNVLVQAGSGSNLARSYAKQLSDLFRGLLLMNDSLEFIDTFVDRGQPVVRSGNWWLLPMYIEWRRVAAAKEP